MKQRVIALSLQQRIGHADVYVQIFGADHQADLMVRLQHTLASGPPHGLFCVHAL